jgi:hypothetical protein
VLQDAFEKLNNLGEGLHGRIRIQVLMRLHWWLTPFANSIS